jgi:hypothetical protein
MLGLLSIGTVHGQIFIAPIDDRCIYNDGSYNLVVNNGYVVADGYIEGALDFSKASLPTTENLFLEVNPYGEPNTATSVSVYGLSNAASTIQPSDWGTGVYVGSFANVSSLGFGQEDLLNITNFVQSSSGPYVEFLLTGNGGDALFSSLDSNYGTPSGIIATPEPSTSALLLGGLGLLAFWRLRTRYGLRVNLS